jgi:CBS domain-containing protein
MTFCPYCGVEIIEGADECEQCGQTLTDLSLPQPASYLEADLLRDRIEVLSPRIPSTVSPDTPVREALAQMVSARIGCVMVVDGDRLVGIFTERDAVDKLNTDAARMAHQPVARFMTRHPVTLSADDEIVYAVHKMHVGGYRHLPILAGENLRGVISIRDILYYLTNRIALSRGV